MTRTSITYVGGLHCELKHEQSGSLIETDAPKDNQGKGERFSPTDLVGAALGSCILTTIAMVAEREGIVLQGKARAEVEKKMITEPPRRIGGLHTKVFLPGSIPADKRHKLEETGRKCPVHKSIHPEIDAPIQYVYE